MLEVIRDFISSLPEEEFEARLKSLGIEERNIQKLKEQIYVKKEEENK